MNAAREFRSVSIWVSRRRGHPGLAGPEREGKRAETRLAVGGRRHACRPEEDLSFAIPRGIARCVRKKFQAKSGAGGAVKRS